jgi:hypothetical protein
VGRKQASFLRHYRHDRCLRRQAQIRAALAIGEKVNATGVGRFREKKVNRRAPVGAGGDSGEAEAKTPSACSAACRIQA